MKLRCNSDSIRLRLDQKEVSKFVQAGELVERLEIPGPEPTAFIYRLQLGRTPGSSAVRFENGELTITVPGDKAHAWANSKDEVGLYYSYEVAGGKSLRVMIEKDHQCVEGPADKGGPAGYHDPLTKAGRKHDTR